MMNKLYSLLRLQPLNLTRFKTISKPKAPPGGKGTFGGIMVSQSLLASMQTVPVEFRPSSLHCYFLIGGNPEHDIEYDVESLRSGKNFIHKQVKAYQFDKLIFISTILFYREPAPDKLHALCRLGKLSSLPDFDQFHESTQLFQEKVVGNLPNFQRVSDILNGTASSKVQERFKDGTVDYRLPSKFFANDSDSDSLEYYLRVREQIPATTVPEYSPNMEINPETDVRFNYVAFAYLSDSYVLLSLPYFHQLPLYSHKFSASLDHTIHFHQLPKVNNWMFAQLFNPRSHHDKHLIIAHYYDKDTKELSATITQEGLVAYSDKEAIISMFKGDSKL